MKRRNKKKRGKRGRGRFTIVTNSEEGGRIEKQ